jgi:hypothetical protein
LVNKQSIRGPSFCVGYSQSRSGYRCKQTDGARIVCFTNRVFLTCRHGLIFLLRYRATVCLSLQHQDENVQEGLTTQHDLLVSRPPSPSISPCVRPPRPAPPLLLWRVCSLSAQWSSTRVEPSSCRGHSTPTRPLQRFLVALVALSLPFAKKRLNTHAPRAVPLPTLCACVFVGDLATHGRGGN